MKVTLTLNQRQLDVLLSQLESTLNDTVPWEQQIRGPQLAYAAIQGPPHCFSYDNAQLAPVYLQLVQHWKKPGIPAAAVMAPDDQRAWAAKHATARQDLQCAEVRHA